MQSRATASAERTALRLSSQFRRDVHDASAAELNSSGKPQVAFLKLNLEGGRSVEYSHREGVVLRRESGDDAPEWREDFVFPTLSQLTIDDAEDAPRRLALTIAAKPMEQQAVAGKPLASPMATPTSLHVEAIVGLYLRLRAASSAQEAPK